MSDFAVTFRSTACLLYHFVAGLSRGFAKLFLSFFNLSTELVALADSFVIISLLLHFVNTFFHFFLDFSAFIFRRTNFPLFIDYFRSIYYNIYDFVFTGAF